MMTSFAFILGLVPLVIATGAGAATQRAVGTAVFGGMIAASFLGIFVIPGLYVSFQWAAREDQGHGQGPGQDAGDARRRLARSCFSSNRPWRSPQRVHSGVDRLDADGTRVSGQESTNPPTSRLMKNTPYRSAPLQGRSEIMSAHGVARSDEHHHARDTA